MVSVAGTLPETNLAAPLRPLDRDGDDEDGNGHDEGGVAPCDTSGAAFVLPDDGAKETSPPPARPTPSFDDILVSLGEFGKHQRRLYLMFSATYVLTAMNLHSWTFLGPEPKHRCALPGENRLNADFYSDPDWDRHQGCSSSYGGNNGTCRHGRVYDLSEVGWSVVSEWDLVCDRRNLRAAAPSVTMVGYLLGALIFGTLSDHVGRKSTFLAANWLLLGSGLLSALVAHDYWTFLVGRTLMGGAVAGMEGSCFLIGMELVGPSKRTVAGTVCWFFETLGLLAEVGLAHGLLRLGWGSGWRTLLLAYTAPAALFSTYALHPYESVRWLLSRGHAARAERLLLQTSKVNGVELAQGQLSSLLNRGNGGGDLDRYTVLDLFRHRNLAIKTCILQATWAVCSALYYVLLLDQSELSSNPHLGFLATALVQLPGYVFVILTVDLKWLGRRRLMSASLLACGACMTLHPCLGGNELLKVGLSMMGRFSANCSFTVLNLYTAELFPTVIRGVGMGFCLVASRIGPILAPHVLLLGGDAAAVILGAGAVGAGAISLLLPETLGETLPETIQDEEDVPLVLPWNYNSAIFRRRAASAVPPSSRPA